MMKIQAVGRVLYKSTIDMSNYIIWQGKGYAIQSESGLSVWHLIWCRKNKRNSKHLDHCYIRIEGIKFHNDPLAFNS